MKRLLLIALLLATKVSFSQNYLLLSTGATDPTGTGNSVIYQDPTSGNLGIGNTSPALTLDVTGVVGTGISPSTAPAPPATWPAIIGANYTYTTTDVPSDAPNFYFTARRIHEISTLGTGDGPTTSYTSNVDFAINNIGQTAIGDVTYSGIDLRIHSHNWPTPDNPIAPIMVGDDNSLTLFAVQNVGTSTNSCGYMFVHSNSAGTSNPAIAVLDQAHNLNPMFMVTSDGLVNTGVDRGIGAIAQLDVMYNNSVVDYMLHVGAYGPGATTSDFFTINNGGYVGIGAINPGNALVEVSDINGLGASNIPLFTIDNGEGKNYLRVTGTTSGLSPGTGLQLFAGANTGWGTQIQFFNADATSERHFIADDFGTGNLLIWPGWDHSASNVLELAGSQQIDGNDTIMGNQVLYGDDSILGRVCIGATRSGSTLPNAQFANYQLSVDGQIASKELIVQVMSWSDTVFSSTYKLKPLQEVQEYIQNNRHLPEVPDEKEVMQNGVSVGQMNATLLKKVEELTLYALQQQKRIDKLQQQLDCITR